MRRSFGTVTPERYSSPSRRELDRIWDSSFGNCSKQNDRVTTGHFHRLGQAFSSCEIEMRDHGIALSIRRG